MSSMKPDNKLNLLCLVDRPIEQQEDSNESISFLYWNKGLHHLCPLPHSIRKYIATMEHLLINQEQFPQLVSRTGSENIASLIVDFQKKHYREMKLRAEAEIEGLGPEIIRMLLNGRDIVS